MITDSFTLDRQMRSICTVVTLSLVILAVLLTTGCVGEMMVENRTETITPAATSSLSPTMHEQLSIPARVLTSEDYWIRIDPINGAHKNNVTLSGTTNLPEGEMLEIDISTIVVFPKPTGYDYSHEDAGAETSVDWVNTTTRGFSAVIDVSQLYPGKYASRVQAQRNLSIYTNGAVFDLLPARSPTGLNNADYLYDPCASLPPLHVNGSLEPILISGSVSLVPPNLKTQSNQISYGAIMLFSNDGIDRIFDENGTQVAAWYDSNELHLWQIPDGSSVQESGNITYLYLGEKRILTKIYEKKPCE